MRRLLIFVRVVITPCYPHVFLVGTHGYAVAHTDKSVISVLNRVVTESLGTQYSESRTDDLFAGVEESYSEPICIMTLNNVQGSSWNLLCRYRVSEDLLQGPRAGEKLSGSSSELYLNLLMSRSSELPKPISAKVRCQPPRDGNTLCSERTPLAEDSCALTPTYRARYQSVMPDLCNLHKVEASKQRIVASKLRMTRLK